MMESKSPSKEEVSKNLSNLLTYFTNESNNKTKEGLIQPILTTNINLLKKSITFPTSSSSGSNDKRLIREKKVFLVSIEFLHRFFKEIDSKLDSSIWRSKLEANNLFDELAVCLICGLEDSAYRVFTLSSMDANYETIAQESLAILTILCSDHSDKHYRLVGSTLAQLVQVLLVYVKSSQKSFAKIALPFLLKLLDCHGTADDWRQFFPGIFTGLFMTITGSRSKTEEIPSSKALNELKSRDDPNQSHSRKPRLIYEAYLGLIKLINIVANDNLYSNRALIRYLRSPTISKGKDRLSSLQQLELEAEELESAEVLAKNLEANLPYMFSSLDAFIQWRVDLLQRLGRYLPTAIRSIRSEIEQSAELVLTALPSKRAAVTATITMLVQCTRYLGTKTQSAFFSLLDLIIYYADDADQQTQSLAKEGWKTLSQHFLANADLLDEWLAIKQELGKSFLSQLRSLTKSTICPSLRNQLQSILGYGQVLMPEIQQIFLSVEASFLREHIIKLFTSADRQLKHQHPASHRPSTVIGEEAYYQLENRYYDSLSAKVQRQGLWLAVYQPITSYSADESRLLRRLAMLLGRGGALGVIIDCIEQCDQSEDSTRQAYEHCMDDAEESRLSVLAAASSSMLPSPTLQQQVTADPLPWMIDYTSSSSKNHAHELKTDYLHCLDELAAAWRILAFAIIGCVELETHTATTSISTPIVCQHCQKHSESLSRCSRCKSVWYCSATHQRADWANHKVGCQSSTTATIAAATAISQPHVQKKSQDDRMLMIEDPYQLLSAASSYRIKDMTILHLIASLAINSFHRHRQHQSSSNTLIRRHHQVVLLVLLEVLGNLCWVLADAFDLHLRELLYSLLLLTVDEGDQILSRTAISTLHRISLSMAYPSVESLIGHFLDRIIDESSRAMQVNIYETESSSQLASSSSAAYRVLEAVLDILDHTEGSSDHSMAREDAVAMVQNILLTALTSVDSYAATGLMSDEQIHQLLKALQGLILRSIPQTSHHKELLTSIMLQHPSWKKFLQPYTSRRRNIFSLDQSTAIGAVQASAAAYSAERVDDRELRMDLVVLSLAAFRKGYHQLLGEIVLDRQPQVSSAARKIYDGPSTVINHDDEEEDQGEANSKFFINPCKESIALIEQSLERCNYLLSLPSIASQIIVLETIGFAYLGLLRLSSQTNDDYPNSSLEDLLAIDQRYLYPMLHKSWSSIIARLKELRQMIVAHYSLSATKAPTAASSSAAGKMIRDRVSLVSMDESDTSRSAMLALTDASFMNSSSSQLTNQQKNSTVLDSLLDVASSSSSSQHHQQSSSSLMLLPPLMV
jgi:hypothetical protein